ncbi:MAG: YicC family protein [Bacteroidia bacterium]|nr:YicC family protein [Bacteroidia bacterium]
MTGFGKAVCEVAGNKITIEIKSLNSKQADISVKMPQKFREKEVIIRNDILKSLGRGKIDFNLNEDKTGSDRLTSINDAVVEEYFRKISDLSIKLGLPVTEQVMQVIMRLPDSLSIKEEEINEDEWRIISECISQVLSKVQEYRQQEGQVLEADITSNLNNIIHLLEQVKDYEDQRITTIRQRINNSLSEVYDLLTFDKNRFEQELIYYLEKLDINEEKVRLANHCSYFLETMKQEKVPGRKLGFISQEIGREINTIGSKANDANIQKIVVRMKDELEKIKEQLLNVL